MGCVKKSHVHTWPTKGHLIIQRCEVRCNYCTGDAKYKDWKYAWFLRRHVRAIHAKKGKYKGIQVDAGWNDENPHDSSETRRGSSRVKAESPSPGADFGVPQTMGELETGPLPDFVTQPNFGNFDDSTYNKISKSIPSASRYGHSKIDYSTVPAAYGNPNAQFPTLADEDPFGMHHTKIVGEFQNFINSTPGYDGSPDEEEDVRIIDIDQRMSRGNGEPAENSIPDSSSARFFMSDPTAVKTSFDEEDELPLAHMSDDYTLTAPNDQMHNNVLQTLSGFSNTIRQSGMDPSATLPTMHLFMRELHQ